MSAINTIVKQPAIPFSKKKEEGELQKIKLEHMVTINVTIGTLLTPFREKRTDTLLVCHNDDVESLICLVLTFLEASKLDGLSLPDGLLYTEFHKCLEDIVLDTYDSLLLGVATHDRASFLDLINELIGQFTDPTAYADQKQYMDTYKKPFKLAVNELTNRLIIINKYTRYLPGSNGDPIYTDTMIKYAFYNMMISQWQWAFAGSAHMELSDPNYMLQALVRYMAMQETIMNQHTSIANDRNRNRNRGNFSFGHQPTRHSHQPYSNARRTYWQPHHQQNHPSSFPPFPCRQFGGREQPQDQQIPRWDYQHQHQPGCYMSRGSYATNPDDHG